MHGKEVEMFKAGLVLEGGGMRGVYTAGLLDFFLDKGIDFSNVYGVSAGAIVMCSYLSKQKERAYRIYTDYIDNKNYCSVYSLLTTGDLFNVNMCYELIPNYLDPFDNDTFKQYEGKAYAVVTNIKSGKAEYIRIKDGIEDLAAVRASGSLPLVSRSVKIGDGLYLDGALADSIPIRKSILDGNRKNIVVLTKEEGFVREPSSFATLALAKTRYAVYPKVYETMRDRHLQYNTTMDYLKEREENGQAFVFRPTDSCGVGRIEKDVTKLHALYRAGYEDGEKNYERMLEYLND